MKSGETHMPRTVIEGEFEFLITRNNWNYIRGPVSFLKKNSQSNMQFLFSDSRTNSLCKDFLDSKELKIELKESIVISGTLVRPINPIYNAIAVFLHGDGDNDRYDLYDIGMYLVYNGYSVFSMILQSGLFRGYRR